VEFEAIGCGTTHKTERVLMTRLMEQAVSRASELSDEEQDALAAILLREIESERRWDTLFSRPTSADLLGSMADEALAEADAGGCRPLNLDEL
jgi:hypothetical protein